MSNRAVKSVTIEPGNCTRYDLDLVNLGPLDLLVILYKNRDRVGGRAMRFESGRTRRTYTPADVSKSMGCDMPEAAVILAYLRDECAVLANLPEDFSQETGVWVGHTVH